jgi:hypothetical protein
MNRWLMALCICLIFVALPSRADKKRQLGAHEHGSGTLNIAVEGRAVTMALEIPGTDIVGFEHEAKTAADQAKLAAATQVLREPLALFKPAVDAGCTLKDAKVAFESDAEEAAAKPGAKPAASGDGHKEFHANYTLDCADPVKLTALDFAFFKSFSGAKKLTVNVISAKGQSRYEVSRAKPRVDFRGGL